MIDLSPIRAGTLQEVYAMARKKWKAEEKARIVMEVLTTNAPLSEGNTQTLSTK
ncbi:MAG: hypothetical protein QXU32_05130 [Nitrososphaerales archaeon]